MILINSKPLEKIALQDSNHPMHSYALEYDKGMKDLRDKFGDKIVFYRTGYPRRCKGIDARNRPVENMAEPTPPLIIKFSARVYGDAGMEIWEYSPGQARPLPNGLWEATGKRSLFVTEILSVSIDKEQDFAFWLYYKSPYVSRKLDRTGKPRKGRIYLHDPVTEARLKGDKKRAELDLNTAIYSILGTGNEDQLRLVAQSFGIGEVDKKDPDQIRLELEAAVLANEQKKKTSPHSRGVKEFLDDVKITDATRIRGLINTAIEDKVITWNPDGYFKIGDADICKVPPRDLERKQDFLCNFLLNPGNKKKLSDLLEAIITKEYLDKITDTKTFYWLARAIGISPGFKKGDALREEIYAHFVKE